ncbi:hypothetical protein AYL99_04368 [Fonsecaea erecta]|uniref:Uncharacterized protein n=1 Tax=Fonsecaea erecta TaxID=1367422 RepID=A0A178ZT39_9EURO|nr:hypothetical protein AYL99_04368 [Fonsecaea erecta]OAP62165.1 hypothetical protein AYL99_04368 [Fonsecaea erecta]
MFLVLSAVLTWATMFIIPAQTHSTEILSSMSMSTLTETVECTTTAYTAPVIQAGPTSTYYSLTTYTSHIYDCHGCDTVVVLPYGHVFVEETFTITVTASNATTITLPRCSLTPGPAVMTTPN